MTSNNQDVFPSLMATDGSKLFIDNQSVDGGRLILAAKDEGADRDGKRTG